MKLIDVLDCLKDTEYIYVDFDDSKRWNWFWSGEVKHGLLPLHDHYNRRVIRLEPTTSSYEEEEVELIIILEGGLK